MSLVTLTDHDTIDGGLTLIDRPDFFLSEEVTTRFPENGFVMHVLAWNITRDQHDEIQACRDDIYRLSEYLNRAAIAHALAHPLVSLNARLDAATFEKLLLMFPTLEGTNGLTDPRIEPELTTILERLTPEVIAALARKHGMTPNGAAPHRKALTAGADDHGGGRAGTVYTELDGADLDPATFLRGCAAGHARAAGPKARLGTIAACVSHTRPDSERRRPSVPARLGRRFFDLMGGLARRLPAKPDGGDIVDGPAGGSNGSLENAVRGLGAAVQSFDVGGVMAGVRDLIGRVRTDIPVLVAAHHFGKQELQVRKLREQWTAFPLPAPERRLALFSDSLEQVDGVSTWCKRFV